MIYQLDIIFMVFLALLSGIHSKISNHKNVKITLPNQRSGSVIVKKGDELDVKFSVDHEVLGCSFRSPRGKTHIMTRGAAYEDGRIQQRELNDNDCAMKITNIINLDAGRWQSNITYSDSEGTYQVVTGTLHVTVAIPPDNVLINDTGSNPINITDNPKTFKCSATGAYPAPEFKWYINDIELNVNDANYGDTKITTTDNEAEDGSTSYVSILEHKLKPSDNGHILRCEVLHEGYTTKQIEKNINQDQVNLSLQFKPQNIEFFHQKQKNTIDIRFWANPAPFIGHWCVDLEGGSKVNLTSEDFELYNDGQYQVVNIEHKQPIFFEVTNELGTSDKYLRVLPRPNQKKFDWSKGSMKSYSFSSNDLQIGNRG